MKQVIVRIRDCRLTYRKTIARYYFLSVSSYHYDVMDCVKTLLPGQEIEIKVGSTFCKYISYEDILNLAEDYGESFDDCLYHELVDDSEMNYYIKNYLPTY